CGQAMNRSYIDMHLAVDRYLRGTLTEAETAEFEERLVWDQALIDEVDVAQKLQEGLRAALARNEAASPVVAGLPSRIASVFRSPIYAAAASFLVAVGLTSTGMLSVPRQGDVSPATDRMPTEIVALYATRSNDAISVVVSENAWTVLLVDAPYGYESFRAEVTATGEGAPAIWTQQNLLPTYPDSLAIGMPGRALVAGRYELVLEGRMPDADGYQRIQRIAFNVTPGDANNNPSPQ
ncbi:MAG: hypothetical protein AAGA61_10810, partial [Pseudomonadota bacterium]